MTQIGEVESLFGHGGIEMSSENSLTRKEVMIWLEASCIAQGVPLFVADRVALRKVGVLLGMGTEGLDGAEAEGTSSARAERARRPAHRRRDHRAS